MSCFRTLRSLIVVVLLILPHILANDVNPKLCSPCYTSVCPDSCLLTCALQCPQNYYPSALTCETPTTTATTTKSTTVKTTTTTATTTTTTTPTTTTLIIPVVPTTNAPITLEHNSLNRRRRQVQPEVTNQVQPYIETPETTAPAVETTTLSTTPTTILTTPTTTTTTTPLPSIVCRRCSVESCALCQDDSRNMSICARCTDGYSISNDMSSCSKDGLSGGAIAGIVIGILCFVAIVVVVGLFLVRRRFPWAKDATDPHLARNTSQSFVDDAEQYEIRKLPDAPSPPTEDTSKRYDSLKPANQDDPQSYSPLEIRKESGYVNSSKTEQTNPYANTKQDNTTGPSASDKTRAQNKTKVKSVSPNNAELYEDINTTRHNEMQGAYANAKAIKEQFKKTANAETTPGGYYNNTNDIVEAVYENP